MTSDIETKFESTFRDLELAVEATADRNLTRVLAFIMSVLGAAPEDNLIPFFSADPWPDTKVTLRRSASNHWTKRSTLQSELSRITTIGKISQELIQRGGDLNRGYDPEYLRALKAIRVRMKSLHINSVYDLERAAHGRQLNYIAHLFDKKRKYHPNRSKKAEARLKQLCEYLELDWQEMRPDLIEEAPKREEKSRLNAQAFSYFLKVDKLPKNLRDDIAAIVRFHRDASPGRQPDGKSKRRTKKSHWKVRSTDGRCRSQENLYSLLGSFFGYCVLPCDKTAARVLVKERLQKTSIKWRREDLPLYDSWLTGVGMEVKDLSLDLLFNTSLVEQWLNWLAGRNGGMSKTQSSYCIILCGLFNGSTGAIPQSYEIARRIMNFPVMPRVLTKEDKIQFSTLMEEWAKACEETKLIYKDFREAFSSSKVKRKRRAIQRHEQLLSLENPLAAVQKMLRRLHLSEPLHLGTGSTSWKLWVRNVSLVELLISNPLRADNICHLRHSPDGTGTLRSTETGFEIFLEKYEVKNPHEEKEFGYRGGVSPTASAWLNFYITEVRPYWDTNISAEERLFLTRTGAPIDEKELRTILIKISEQFLPEFPPLNTHAFRHIVATSWLKQHPDDYITVSLILGDRLTTVMSEYAHLASTDGLIRYHRHLAKGPQMFPSAVKER